MAPETKPKWYLRPGAILVAILLVGPFAIPLVWISPAIKKPYKIVITILLIALTIWFIKASADLVKLISTYETILSDIMKH